MKTTKLLLITKLFFTAFVFGACNPNSKDSDTDNTVSAEGLSKPSVKNSKNNSTANNDTIITPPDDSMNKNNPDITK
ncbi:MAG TPA: hypothetical protein VNX01_08525 [Bacteroidia bacterium]|jgi:hypothetical protein|nr:hypothetical protein [Bacteroidia bacterium]